MTRTGSQAPMPPSRLNIPNIISIGRIAACPAVFLLALSRTAGSLYLAFALFLAAALSDLWDGYLARKHGWITDMGKLLDPLADKLLLVSTLIPFLIVSRRGPEWEVPWWGPLPVWVVAVILGRELFMTLFRSWAAGRGVVIQAGQAGKYKAFIQNLFAGGLLLWYGLSLTAATRGWNGSGGWALWAAFHRSWVGVMLGGALFLTVYSMGEYLWRHRAITGRTA